MFSWFFSEPLPVGSAAPDFTLPDQDGSLVTLSALRGQSVVLIFYPADETRICRKQLCEFRDAKSQHRGVLVYGVNPGNAESHSRFRTNQNLQFPLLIDKGQKVATIYRANGWMVRRTVYLIGMNGIIQFARRGTPSPHDVYSVAGIPQE